MTQTIGSLNGPYGGYGINDISQINTNSNDVIDTSGNKVVEPPPEQIDEKITDGMIEQLNRLLGRATKETFESVNPKTLDGLLSLKSMKPVMAKIKVGAKAVKALADKASQLMTQLNGLTCLSDYDKLFGDKVPKDVPPLHIQAMNAQLDLSDALRAIINRMDGPELTDKQYAVLEEMQFKCDARATEINRWAGQMETLYREQKAGASNPQQKVASSSVDGFGFDTPVGQALAELSGKMHGTQDGLVKLASSNRQVCEFLQTLDEFKKSGDAGEVSAEDYKKLETAARAAQTALEKIAEKGIVDDGEAMEEEPEAQLVKGQGGHWDIVLEDDGGKDDLVGQQPSSGSWRLDPAAMKALASNIGEALDVKLQNKGAMLEVSSRVIRNELGLPSFFQALKAVPRSVLDRATDESGAFDCLFQAERVVNKAMMDFIRNPTAEQKKKMHAEIKRTVDSLPFERLMDETRHVAWVGGNIVGTMKKRHSSNPQVQEKIAKVLQPLQDAELNGIDDNKDFRFLKDDGSFYKQKINAVMAFLEKMVEQGDLKGARTREFVESVFHGNYPVSSLVEIRLHGVDDEDIQMDAVDANLEDSCTLGEGAANEVVLCKYRNDKTYVFKPELPGEWGLHHLNLGRGKAYSSHTKVYNLNIASQKFSELFGLENGMVTSKAGVLKGQFGFFMSVAPGKSLNDLGKEPAKTLMSVKINSKNDKRQIQKNMVFQFNELQWLDLLTGQGDRHGGNIMMEVSDDVADPTLSLKGIDNDMCFAENRVGAHAYILTKEQNTMMQDFASKLEKFFEKGTVDAGKKIWKDCMQKQSDGTYRMDIGKMQEANNPYLIMCARNTIGCQSSTLPTYITKSLYEKLQLYKNDEEARRTMINELRNKHLSEAALDAMSTRLDELTAYAETLNENGMVIDPADEGWLEVLKKSRQRHEEQVDGVKKQIRTVKNDNGMASRLQKCRKTMMNDYYFRFVVDQELEPRTDLP